MVIGAAALCVFLAGVWQILFGLFRVASIIKFTPHPVFAGFVNGAALLIIKAQIIAVLLRRHQLLRWRCQAIRLYSLLSSPWRYWRSSIGSVVTTLKLPLVLAKVPGTIVTFALGILLYHFAKWVQPTLDLGPTIGKPAIKLTSPLIQVLQPDAAAPLWTAGGSILLVSLVLALVTSLEILDVAARGAIARRP